jgi:dTDP-4-amino-4,6-dideoxygalactose transaminase
VEELEHAVARYSQCEFGIGVSSGTDALLVALMALKVGPGDAVITSPYTFFATGGAIARLGARPIFCDIDPTSYNICPRAVSRTIDAECEIRDGVLMHLPSRTRVKVLLPVHLFGQTADLGPLLAIARQHGLKVVEDAAQAIGSESPGGQRAGSLGDIGCFSFFPSKNLGAFGDGGMCTTSDPDLAERLRVLRAHGGKPKYHHALIGGNFRLDALQAAVLSVKLRHLDEWTSRRQANAKYYDSALAKRPSAAQLQSPVALPGYRHIYNQYVVRTNRRDALRKHLTERHIGTEVYYPIPLHMQACFNYLGYRPQDCPESARAAAETLALPIYPELTRNEQDLVVESVCEFFA